ncbi:hypothetical protein CJ030_MR0G004680 [Morella rubra]|uniref:Uncharacterized protein n=1 Tax=Morella rubra TaxID=262757 RepID=A0A6A1ULQ1_9ROSI|nr:hypothetical protein CJ030_MR0G004680 [Morella rubra]
MSDNQNLEQVLEGPGTVVDKPEDWFPEAKSDPAEALDSEQSHASLAEDSNGHAAEPEVPLERGDSDDVVEPANQGDLLQASLSSPIDRVGSDIGDAGKEDMFVDCPDELATATADNKIAVVTTGIEESSEEKNGADENGGLEMKNGTRVSYVVDDELDHLRAKLEKMLSEKEGIAREYQEERQAIAKEVAELHHHLKALANKQPMLVLEKDNLMGDTPLLEMAKDCSQLLKTASEERLDTETAVRELLALLYAKEKEIEDLNARVSEISVSNDVVGSYWSSFQNEKDRQVEDVANRILTSLALVGYKEEPLDDSGLGKIIQLEKGTSLLIEKFNHVLSEIDQLGQCLSGAGADLRLQEEYGNICVAARDQLLELKSKEVNLVEKVRHLEDENRKFMVQLEKDKEMAEMVNAELAKTKMELEQEKVRCANTKEKLTMAVTKGKALVQQRDSLKQSLAEKTSELEKCVLELEEKSSALEAAELSKEELVRSDNLVASLQETLLQRNAILEKVEEILSENAVPEEIDSMDIIERFRWLVDDRNLLKDVSMEFQNLKDAFFSMDLPETVSSSNLEARFSYLRESFYQAKNEKNTLQHEIAITREAARNEIDRLSASLSTALQEKDSLQTELADLMCKWEETVERERLVSLENERLSASLLAELQEKDDIRIELADLMSKYEEIVEKEQRVSLDRDQTIKILLEISGTEMENEEAVYQSSDNSVLIHRCFEKIKEQSSASSDSYHVNAKVFETIQCLLYVRDQELMLFEKLLEEEMMVRLEVDKLSCELKSISEELVALKEEKGSLLKDLERSEEKSALLRERLSMAVKKGKGLVQDRENLKNLLDENNSEIEKLKLKLQQQESAVADCRDQIKTLSIDVECIPKLEADLVAMKDQRDQLEQFLVERNKLLQRLVESIDGIVLPVESVFEDPIGKVNLLAGYVNECLDARTHAEQELRKVEEDASTLASKLEEAKGNVKSLEDALAVLENNVSQLAEEKREIEVGKTNVEQELQKAIEEACSHTTKFVEACATRKSLEEALSQAENKISVFLKEKEDARVSRDAVEMELDKVKGEVAIQTSKLTEAYKTIKSLEDSLSQVETNVTLLTEQNNYAQVDRTNLENEVKKLQEEAGSQANKLADACATIKSMEDALLKAENDISVLVSEKKNAEEKVLLLNSKLDAALEELDGTSGSLKSRSVELTTHFNDLQGILKDETLPSKMKECFEKKFEGLKNMDLVLKNIRDRFVDMDLEELKSHHVMEDNSLGTKPFSDSIYSIADVGIDKGWVNAADGEDNFSIFRKSMEGFQSRDRILADKLEGFSLVVDEFIASLLRKSKATEDGVIVLFEHIESLKQKTRNLEISKQEQESTIRMLRNDVTTLLSVCTDATRELHFDVKNNLLELSHVPELERLDHSLFLEMRESEGDATVAQQQRLDGGKHVEAADKLLFVTRKVQALIKQFESSNNMAAATIEELLDKLKESRKDFEKAVEERDQNQNRVSKLETDVEALQNSCSQMRHKLMDYQNKEGELNKREEEVSSLYNSLLVKEQEAEDSLLSASQVITLFDKVRDIDVPIAVSKLGEVEPHNSSHIKKLFYIIDSVPALQQQVNLLSQDKDELESTLTTQVLEIEHLKREIENHSQDKQDSEKLKKDLSELTFGLEKIISTFRSSDLVDQKFTGVKGLLSVLEKQVVSTLLESENSKSKVQELGIELLARQKAVDELSTRVKLLEDSIQGSSSQPEIVQERNIFEAPPLPTGSEISEIEDAGSLGQNTTSLVPPAVQVRTLRKGSTDHLSINIDGESERLISSQGTDEDKGHIFKALNTSGLIPKQGKLIADRVDGIW